MAQTAEAVLEPNGEIRLLEPLSVSKSTRLLVTVVPERPLGTLYDEAKSSVSTEELERASCETGGRTWSEIRQRLGAE
jgi:hypothetical protein